MASSPSVGNEHSPRTQALMDKMMERMNEIQISLRESVKEGVREIKETHERERQNDNEGGRRSRRGNEGGSGRESERRGSRRGEHMSSIGSDGGVFFGHGAHGENPFVNHRRAGRGATHAGGRGTRGYARQNWEDEDRFDERNLKFFIPKFNGSGGADVYLEWAMKVDQILGSYPMLSEERKLHLVTLEFEEYALVWWHQQERGNGYLRPRITTWEELKQALKERFVPPTYMRDLHHKLQRLVQGSRSVQDYYKDLEVTMLRAQVEESLEATMARFVHGLNREVQDVLELQRYSNLEEAIHLAERVEAQLRRRSSFKRVSTSSA